MTVEVTKSGERLITNELDQMLTKGTIQLLKILLEVKASTLRVILIWSGSV